MRFAIEEAAKGGAEGNPAVALRSLETAQS